MSTPATTRSTIRFFRETLLAFSFVVGCYSVWNLGAESCREAISYFPISAQDTATVSRGRHATTLAASFGVIRGDLWAECALTYLSIFWNDGRQIAVTQPTDEMAQARRVAYRALSYAPYDSRIWLMLASIDVKLKRDARSALQMSYYTGPNEAQLIPLRLILATESDAIDDVQIQQFVKHDIRIILSRAPPQTQAIVTAYHLASSDGQQFLENTVVEFDPTLSLRSTKSPTN